MDLNSFEINNNTYLKNIFYGLPKNVKICSNETNMQNYLFSQNKNDNCSDICFVKNIKLDIIKDECINSCKDNGYNYVCNNICYDECPEGTYPIIKNISNKYNLSIEYEDSVVICLDRNPEGYYLEEDGFYEKCFETCKFCYGSGNEIDNNCSKCISNYLFLSDSKYKNNCYEKCPYYYFFNENNDYICSENCYGNYNKSIIGKKKCIDRCDNDDIYKFEYNNICYEDCPNGTIYNEIESKCLDEKNIPSTFIFGESTNIYNSILNTLIYSNINNGSDFSSSINEINISTKGIFSYIFSEKIGSTFLDNTILYSELKSFLNNILEKSNIPQENETKLISLTNFQSQLNEEISQ